MKKTICLILALLFLFSLSACKKEQTAEPEKTAAETSAETPTDTPDNAPIGATENTPSLTPTAIDDVIYDAQGVTITYLGWDDGEDAGFLFDTYEKYWMLIQNHTDKTILFQLCKTSANGYMADLELYLKDRESEADFEFLLEAGDSIHAGLFTYNIHADVAEMDGYSDLTFALRAVDPETEDPYFITDDITIRVDTAQQIYNEDGHLVYDKNNFKIVVKGPDPESDDHLIVYFYNGMDQDVYVETGESIINGQEELMFLQNEIAAGKHSLMCLRPSVDSELDTIHDVKMSFEVYELDYEQDSTPDEPMFVTDTFSLTF